MGLLTSSLSGLPVVGQAIGVVTTSIKVYDQATSPLQATKIAVKGVFYDCLPPIVKYPIKCAVLLGSTALAVSSGGNPWLTSLVFANVKSIILEEVL